MNANTHTEMTDRTMYRCEHTCASQLLWR